MIPSVPSLYPEIRATISCSAILAKTSTPIRIFPLPIEAPGESGCARFVMHFDIAVQIETVRTDYCERGQRIMWTVSFNMLGSR